MPRLRTTEPDPILGLLRYYQYNPGKLAIVLTCHENTARNRLKKPETLTLRELRRLNRAGVPIERIRAAI